jgi:hypothetical protein
MSATAADMARWGDALYGGRVLNRSIGAALLKFNKDDYGPIRTESMIALISSRSCNEVVPGR